MNFLFYLVYDVISTVSFILLYPFVILARLHTGKDNGTKRIKLGLFKKPELKENVIMFHAVSVGEVLSLDRLLKKVKESFPDSSIVLTTGTKTGQELAHKRYSKILDFITYFPFDIPFAVNNFLRKVQPNVVIITETELWPNFAINCNRKHIPLMIINGRISDKSYDSYMRSKALFAPILNLYTKIYTQSETDNERFISLGNNPDNTEIMPNLKFDIEKVTPDIDLKSRNNRTLIAGSTHAGEDEIIVDVYNKLKVTHKDLKLIIAPRHLERIHEISQVLKKHNLTTGYRSKSGDFENNDIVILDTLGELRKCYAICNIAFIGGSFNKTGGHNPLEAAIYNVPTITGPNIKNFRDIYGILLGANASKLVKTKQELYDVLNNLLTDEQKLYEMVDACENVFKEQRGAIDFVIDKINLLLSE